VKITWKLNRDKIISEEVTKYSLWKLVTYFIIYSVLGLIMEMIYAAVHSGVIESRQGFLYGPFSAIYGVGAVVMILILRYFGKSNIKLFLGSFVLGSAIEYIISFLGEKLIHVQWWNYSYLPFNLNGRICLLYSIIWGILGLVMMKEINPRVDRFIDFCKRKLGSRIPKIIVLCLAIFMLFDGLLTIFAFRIFNVRLAQEYNLDLKYSGNTIYTQLYENPHIRYISDILFSDKKMVRTFPNLKVVKNDGETILVTNIVTNVYPYYYVLPTTNYKMGI